MSSQTIKKIRRELSKGWRKLFSQDAPTAPWPDDFNDAEIKLCRDVGPYTMTGVERIVALGRAVSYIGAHKIPGDMVECGVAAGGSCMAIALTLLAGGDDSRTIWLYDTFDGMPEPGPHDVGRLGTPAIGTYKKRLVDGKSTWINVPLASVRQNMALTGYPAAQIRYVAGRVELTLRDNAPSAVSLLRCDTDWYESTKAELEVLWPRLSPGGVVLFDDYYRWQGSRKAADDYFRDHGIRILLSRIDAHAAIGVKQA